MISPGERLFLIWDGPDFAQAWRRGKLGLVVIRGSEALDVLFRHKLAEGRIIEHHEPTLFEAATIAAADACAGLLLVDAEGVEEWIPVQEALECA